MEEYYTEDQIQEIVGKAHCYLSIIGLKIIDDFTIKGSSYHEDSFYSTFDLLITIENRQAFDITNETFQQLVALLESKTYSTNGCCSPDTDYIFIYGNIQTFKILPLSFLQLTDTPKTYDGSAGLFVRVKSDESGLEFFNFINDFNPDGILNGLGMSIAGSNVLIAAGRWVLSNTTYFTSGTTTLAIDAQDATLSRYDAVYAATDGLHIISGTLSATPVYPTIPNGTLLVGTVFITPTTVTTTPVIGSYVTTNTNQTGLSGSKTWTGKQTYAVAPTFQNTPTGTPSSILALDSSDNLIHISASTYVPYTGATGNVSLGNNGLIMTGSGAFIALHSDVQNIGVTSTTFTNLYTAQTYNSFEIHNAVGGLGSTDEYTSLQLNRLSFNNINSTFSQYLVPTSSSLSGNITNTMPSISGVLAVDSNIVHITGLETISGNKTFTGNTVIDPTTGTAQPGLQFNNSSHLTFKDATNTTTRFAQVGPDEFWINSSDTAAAIVVIKNGQLYNRDGGGIETPYLISGGTIAVDFTNLTSFTTGSQNINPISGHPISIYKNAIYTAQSVVGMQGNPEVNVSFNMNYDATGKVGVHQAFDTTLGAIWYAAGPNYWRMQYAPANVLQTGVGNITFTGGSGYTDGTYDLATTGGTGTLEHLQLVISGGIVTSCVSSHIGNGYTIGDVLSVSGIGAGTGFSATVTSLYTDIWNSTGKNIFIQGDIVTGTVQVGTTGNYTPVAGATMNVSRSTTNSYASIAGTTDGRGIIINGDPRPLTAANVYLNHDNTGSVFIAGGNGNVTFGTNGAPSSGFGVFNTTTANSGSAFGMRLRPTVIASANSDTLYGAYFDAIYTQGSFTTVANVAARFNSAPIQFQTISTPTNLLEGMFYHTGSVLAFYTGSTLYRAVLQTNVTASSNQGLVSNSTGQFVPTTSTGTGAPVLAISPTFTGAPLSTTAAFNTNTTQIATTAFVKGLNYLKTIFVPTTGNTVTLVAHNYNIINPAGTLAALTFVMPTSPVDGDILFVKFIQAVTTITWPAAVKGAVTTVAAASEVILIYDSSSTNWY